MTLRRPTSHRSQIVFALTIGLLGSAGCGLAPVEPAPRSTNTPVPTQTPPPTPAATLTPVYEAVPTSSLHGPQAVPLAGECRAIIDGMADLKADLVFPDHFQSGDPVPGPEDFDPNRYFEVLSRLSMAPGYHLDYVYFGDELGGKPLLYARKSGSAPFESYEAFLQSQGEQLSGERSYGPLNHAYDYLSAVRTDGTPEGYLQFIVLSQLGDQFYLFWHGLYNDTVILCGQDDLDLVQQELDVFDLDFPPEVTGRLGGLDLEPRAVLDGQTADLRIVTFSKWGGFLEAVFRLDVSQTPLELIEGQWHPLIEYDCGISF